MNVYFFFTLNGDNQRKKIHSIRWLEIRYLILFLYMMMLVSVVGSVVDTATLLGMKSCRSVFVRDISLGRNLGSATTKTISNITIHEIRVLLTDTNDGDDDDV
jgi:hypothetical protein